MNKLDAIYSEEALAYVDVSTEIAKARFEVLSAKIKRLEEAVGHLTSIQDNLLETVMRQNKSILLLIERTDVLARATGGAFVEIPGAEVLE